MRDLSTVPFISFPPFGTIDSFINPTMQQHGLHFNKRIIADTYGLLLHYAQCGLGITILDMFTIEDCMDNVSTYTLHDVLPPRRVVLIFHENAYMTAQSIEFQNYILRSPLPYGCSHFLK